jgi:hypothetical protein
MSADETNGGMDNTYQACNSEHQGAMVSRLSPAWEGCNVSCLGDGLSLSVFVNCESKAIVVGPPSFTALLATATAHHTRFSAVPTLL